MLKKRIGTILLSTIIILTLVPSTTLASNNDDSPFQFRVSVSNKSGITDERAKTNRIPTYVNIEEVPGSVINLDVQGFRPVGGTGSNVWMDETFGAETLMMFPGKWLVRQNVYENGGRSARLRLERYATDGTASGEWSPDSVGSYDYAN